MSTKNLFQIAILAILVFAATSCGNSNSSKQKKTERTEATTSSAIDIDVLLDRAENLAGQEVYFEGVCTHACEHGATKIFMMGSDDTKVIRVEAGKLGAFDTKCVRNVVRIRGILHEERIDEDYLMEWESHIGEGIAHGNGEEGGCSSEKMARGETGNSDAERIADFRTRIQERKQKEGKEYLSFYFVEAKSYEVL